MVTVAMVINTPYRAPTTTGQSLNVASEDYSQGLKNIYTVRTIKVRIHSAVCTCTPIEIQ